MEMGVFIVLETQTQAEDSQQQTSVLGFQLILLGLLCDTLAAGAEAFWLHCVWEEEGEGGMNLSAMQCPRSKAQQPFSPSGHMSNMGSISSSLILGIFLAWFVLCFGHGKTSMKPRLCSQKSELSNLSHSAGSVTPLKPKIGKEGRHQESVWLYLSLKLLFECCFSKMLKLVVQQVHRKSLMITVSRLKQSEILRSSLSLILWVASQGPSRDPPCFPGWANG